MKALKKYLFVVIVIVIAFSMVACAGGNDEASNSSGSSEPSESEEIPEVGDFEVDLTDIETDSDTKTLKFNFEYNNLNTYGVNPADYFDLVVKQDDEDLELKNGTISIDLTKLTELTEEMEYEFKSDNPILLQVVDKNTGDVWVEYTTAIDE